MLSDRGGEAPPEDSASAPFFHPWRIAAHAAFSVILAASAVPLAAQTAGTASLAVTLCGDPAQGVQISIPLERAPDAPGLPRGPHDQMPGCHALCCPRRSQEQNI